MPPLEYVLNCPDDITVCSTSWEDHLRSITVLCTLKEVGLIEKHTNYDIGKGETNIRVSARK